MNANINIVRSYRLLIAAFLLPVLTACVTSEPEGAMSVPNNDSAVSPVSKGPDDAVDNTADAITDAEKSIAELDFRLLAFANKVVSLPGIDSQTYPIEWVEKHCGIRFLKGTGDTVQIGEDTSKRSLLKQYASQYNGRILQACLIFQKTHSES